MEVKTNKQTDRQTDRQTNTKLPTIYYVPLCTRSSGEAKAEENGTACAINARLHWFHIEFGRGK